MFARPNILKEVNAKLAVLEAAIAGNATMLAAAAAAIGVNTSATGVNATAIAANAAAIEAMGFVDRGDPDSYDFVAANLTIDGQYHDLDLSSIIPLGCIAVLIYVDTVCTAANKNFQFSKPGNTNRFNCLRGYSVVPPNLYACQGMVYCSDDRKISYNIETATWLGFNLVVCGWFI